MVPHYRILRGAVVLYYQRGAVMRKIDRIIGAVCACSGMLEDELTGKARYRMYIRPRFVAWNLARREGYSYAQIAERFGRDHSTIINGVSKHQVNMRLDRLYMRLYENSVSEYDGNRPLMVKVKPYLVKMKEPPKKPQRAKDIVLPTDHDMKPILQIKRGSALLLEAIKREHPERCGA